MAGHVYTNASEKYSQNADSKLGSNPMMFGGGKVCIYLANFFYYFITTHLAMDRPSCPVQERCGTLWFFGMIRVNLISHTYFSLSKFRSREYHS